MSRTIHKVIFGAIGKAKKAAIDATGQANTKARPQLTKNASLKPRFIQVAKSVMIIAMMKAITIGPTNFGDTFIQSLL